MDVSKGYQTTIKSEFASSILSLIFVLHLLEFVVFEKDFFKAQFTLLLPRLSVFSIKISLYFLREVIQLTKKLICASCHRKRLDVVVYILNYNHAKFKVCLIVGKFKGKC